eukprot:gene19769-biopygen17526
MRCSCVGVRWVMRQSRTPRHILYVWGWGPSYYGPEPVARARR